jgi:pimeloyl-ACP methyl ester carboxylesterase
MRADPPRESCEDGFVSASEVPSVPTTVRDQWVESPRGRLFTRRWSPAGAAATAGGPANPILLLHDSLGSVALWRDFPAALSRATGREVIAYDRLGFGQSDRREGRLPPDFVAEEASQWIPVLRRQLGFRGFVALGHSVGGGMAVHCAARHAADCEALVTLSAQAFVEERTLEGIRAAQKQFEDPAQVERLARYHGDKARWVLDAWIGTWLDPAFASWTLAEALPRVACPVLAIHGETDEYGSTGHAQAIGRLSGGPATVAVLRGVGHVPQREQPARVLALVSECLDRDAVRG